MFSTIGYSPSAISVWLWPSRVHRPASLKHAGERDPVQPGDLRYDVGVVDGAGEQYWQPITRQ